MSCAQRCERAARRCARRGPWRDSRGCANAADTQVAGFAALVAAFTGTVVGGFFWQRPIVRATSFGGIAGGRTEVIGVDFVGIVKLSTGVGAPVVIAVVVAGAEMFARGAQRGAAVNLHFVASSVGDAEQSDHFIYANSDLDPYMGALGKERTSILCFTGFQG